MIITCRSQNFQIIENNYKDKVVSKQELENKMMYTQYFIVYGFDHSRVRYLVIKSQANMQLYC